MLPTTDDRQTDGRQHIANVNVSSRSLIKRLPGLKMYSYARLSQLNIRIQRIRRLYMYINLIMCHKIIFNLVDVKFDDFFTIALLQQHEAIHLNCLRNIVKCLEILVNAVLMSVIVCHQRLLTLVHYDHSRAVNTVREHG